MGEMQELSTFWFVTVGAVKVVAVFTVVMLGLAYLCYRLDEGRTYG